MNQDSEQSRNCPLTTAQRRGEEAAQTGFDWDDVSGPLAKVAEEVRELEAELARDDPRDQRLCEELGDILFSVVNVARHIDVDAARALETTVAKFDRRLRRVNQWLEADGALPSERSIQALERLWKRAKREER